MDTLVTQLKNNIAYGTVDASVQVSDTSVKLGVYRCNAYYNITGLVPTNFTDQLNDTVEIRYIGMA